MPKPAATGANASRSAAPSSTGVTESPEGATSTRMKNRPVDASPYWWLSVMFPPAARTAPATAWTMPVRSGHASVRIWWPGVTPSRLSVGGGQDGDGAVLPPCRDVSTRCLPVMRIRISGKHRQEGHDRRAPRSSRAGEDALVHGLQGPGGALGPPEPPGMDRLDPPGRTRGLVVGVQPASRVLVAGGLARDGDIE